ncbi:MAG: hypothetical protein RTU30_08980 [Candidatus Thorarchaeota archaeon]
MKKYFVFPCSQCRNFTTAPVGQKRRRCSYCGKIIDIGKAARALFDTPETATAAVKEFNARGSEEFQKAVEKSKDRIRALIPETKIDAENLSEKVSSDLPEGKMKRLMALLEKEAKNANCTLGRVEELCEKYQLEWAWVEEQLLKLANSGVLIFPRPWTVRLVVINEDDKKKDSLQVDVSKDILEVLRKWGGSGGLIELLEHFGEVAVSQSSVESSLANLLSKGEIYEPRPGRVSLV